MIIDFESNLGPTMKVPGVVQHCAFLTGLIVKLGKLTSHKGNNNISKSTLLDPVSLFGLLRKMYPV